MICRVIFLSKQYRDNEYISSHYIIYYVRQITMTVFKYEPYCIVILNDCLVPLYSRYHKKNFWSDDSNCLRAIKQHCRNVPFEIKPVSIKKKFIERNKTIMKDRQKIFDEKQIIFYTQNTEVGRANEVLSSCK